MKKLIHTKYGKLKSLSSIAAGCMTLASSVVADHDQTLITTISDPAYPRNVAGLPAPRTPAEKTHLEEWTSAKFGLFIHWGIYSVLEGKWKGQEIPDLGEQIQRFAKIPGREYVEVAKQFNPVKFDGQAYAKLAKEAGMTYMILTSRHHDGFSMFDTAYSDFDIMDATPYKKDIVKGLADGCRAEGIRLGLYYSNPDWHFQVDPDNNKFGVGQKYSPDLLAFQQNQLTELLSNYGPIMEIFFDMGTPKLEDSEALAKTVRDIQPACLVSGRVMNNQGDFYTLSDNSEAREVLDLPWEAPSTFHSEPGHTWGWKSWVVDPPMDKEVARCVQKLSRVTSLGGNFLLNIGPKPDGTVSEFQTEALQTIGKWVAAHRGSIFDVHTTPFKRSPWGASTWKNNELYLHVAKWPKDGKIRLPDLLGSVSEVRLFADASVKYSFDELEQGGVLIHVPKTVPEEYQTVNTVLCDGEISARAPRVVLTDSKQIVLGKDSLVTRDLIHGMSYACKVKNVQSCWNFEPTTSGKYMVTLRANVKTMKPSKKQKVDTSPRPVLASIGQKLYRVDIPVTPGKVDVELGVVELNAGSCQSVTIVKNTAMDGESGGTPSRFSLEPIWPEQLLLIRQ
jgi:alpha-L-fucosidase